MRCAWHLPAAAAAAVAAAVVLAVRYYVAAGVAASILEPCQAGGGAAGGTAAAWKAEGTTQPQGGLGVGGVGGVVGGSVWGKRAVAAAAATAGGGDELRAADEGASSIRQGVVVGGPAPAPVCLVHSRPTGEMSSPSSAPVVSGVGGEGVCVGYVSSVEHPAPTERAACKRRTSTATWNKYIMRAAKSIPDGAGMKPRASCGKSEPSLLTCADVSICPATHNQLWLQGRL